LKTNRSPGRRPGMGQNGAIYFSPIFTGRHRAPSGARTDRRFPPLPRPFRSDILTLFAGGRTGRRQKWRLIQTRRLMKPGLIWPLAINSRKNVELFRAVRVISTGYRIGLLTSLAEQSPASPPCASRVVDISTLQASEFAELSAARPDQNQLAPPKRLFCEFCLSASTGPLKSDYHNFD
jgi:hypothetical protein